jgi:putative ABC transport system permease protein
VGLALTYWGAGLASRLMPYSFAVDFRPDLQVLLYTVAVTLGVAVVFGMAPALQLSRADIATVLRRDSRSGGRAGVRNVLVVGQIALSIVLVAGAGLFLRSLLTAQAVDLGFDPDGKLLLSVELSNHGYGDAAGEDFIVKASADLGGLPGVDGAVPIIMTPFRGSWGSTFRASGTAYAEDGFDSGFNSVGVGYFDAMRIPIVEGRAFADTDRKGAPLVAIVNQTVADKVWPGESAVGKQFTRSGRDWTVIGVAANAVYYEVGEEPGTQVYIAQPQSYDSKVTFMLSTTSDPGLLAAPAQEVIRSIDPNLAIFNVRTLRSVTDGELAGYRATAVMVTLFGTLALVMAAVGLYGVQSYLVAQRTREIGIRMALGALHRQVAGVILGRGATLAVVGIVLGLGTALASAKLIQGMLFGVSSHDPVTFVSVPVALLVVSLVASFIPAVRASRVDPMVALREE